MHKTMASYKMSANKRVNALAKDRAGMIHEAAHKSDNAALHVMRRIAFEAAALEPVATEYRNDLRSALTSFRQMKPARVAAIHVQTPKSASRNEEARRSETYRLRSARKQIGEMIRAFFYNNDINALSPPDNAPAKIIPPTPPVAAVTTADTVMTTIVLQFFSTNRQASLKGAVKKSHAPPMKSLNQPNPVGSVNFRGLFPRTFPKKGLAGKARIVGAPSLAAFCIATSFMYRARSRDFARCPARPLRRTFPAALPPRLRGTLPVMRPATGSRQYV